MEPKDSFIRVRPAHLGSKAKLYMLTLCIILNLIDVAAANNAQNFAFHEDKKVAPSHHHHKHHREKSSGYLRDKSGRGEEEEEHSKPASSHRENEDRHSSSHRTPETDFDRPSKVYSSSSNYVKSSRKLEKEKDFEKTRDVARTEDTFVDSSHISDSFTDKEKTSSSPGSKKRKRKPWKTSVSHGDELNDTPGNLGAGITSGKGRHKHSHHRSSNEKQAAPDGDLVPSVEKSEKSCRILFRP